VVGPWERARVCSFEQTGTRAFRQNRQQFLIVAMFVRTRIAQPDGLKFEAAFGKLRKRRLRTHPRRYFMKTQSAEPNREVVECAIAEVLGIAQRQGITPADFVRMLDSGMRMSDFLTAMGTFTNPDRADCDFS
jgi:hypothetical protein